LNLSRKPLKNWSQGLSEELTLLREYYESLELNRKEMTLEDLAMLKSELKEAGEYGLADLVGNLKSPEEFFEYVQEEE
jgi:hypothetical protein